jgi:hypothetical protein
MRRPRRSQIECADRLGLRRVESVDRSILTIDLCRPLRLEANRSAAWEIARTPSPNDDRTQRFEGSLSWA